MVVIVVFKRWPDNPILFPQEVFCWWWRENVVMWGEIWRRGENLSYLVEREREGRISPGEQLTSVGPVRASLHSTADSFITILGSSHATAKYIDITIDCNRGDHGFTTGNFPHLGFVINVANLLDHKSEVVVPRQRFIWQVKNWKQEFKRGLKQNDEDSYMWRGVSLGYSQEEGTRWMTCRVCTYSCRHWGRRIRPGSSCPDADQKTAAGCSDGCCLAGCGWTRGPWRRPSGWLCPGPGPCCSPRRSRRWRPGGCKKKKFLEKNRALVGVHNKAYGQLAGWSMVIGK